MSVVSIPVTAVLPGDVVYRQGCGWREVTEAVPIQFGKGALSFMGLILDHPDHKVSATQKHLLADRAACVLYIPIHANVGVQK